MFRTRCAVSVLLAVSMLVGLSTACGLPPPKCPCAIEIADDAAPLTAAPQDKLFALTYSRGGESFYTVGVPLGTSGGDVFDTMVFFETATGEKGALSCAFQDVNANGGFVDVGDTFDCFESVDRQWGPNDVGQPVTIVLKAIQKELVNSGQRGSVEVARGVWTPK